MKRRALKSMETVRMNRAELIYGKINGLIATDGAPDISDETEAGGQLEWHITQIYEARKRLCEKSGISFDGDPDLERVIDSYEALCHVCGLLMYRYGLRDGLLYRL